MTTHRLKDKTARYRLKDDHPLKKRLDELCEKAEELQIYITFFGNRTLICDLQTNKIYDLEDLDSGECIMEFPPKLEYKLTFEK